MLKVQDKPFTKFNIEDITKRNMVTQNVVVCTSLPAGINLCGHTVQTEQGLAISYQIRSITPISPQRNMDSK